MRSGQLRHRVTLEGYTSAPDGSGGSTKTWALLSPSVVSAAIEPLTAAERPMQGTVLSDATHLVTMRYHSGVTTKTRIRYGTRTFQVTSVINIDERNIELRLECKEVKA